LGFPNLLPQVAAPMKKQPFKTALSPSVGGLSSALQPKLQYRQSSSPLQKIGNFDGF